MANTNNASTGASTNGFGKLNLLDYCDIDKDMVKAYLYLIPSSFGPLPPTNSPSEAKQRFEKFDSFVKTLGKTNTWTIDTFLSFKNRSDYDNKFKDLATELDKLLGTTVNATTEIKYPFSGFTYKYDGVVTTHKSRNLQTNFKDIKSKKLENIKKEDGIVELEALSNYYFTLLGKMNESYIKPETKQKTKNDLKKMMDDIYKNYDFSGSSNQASGTGIIFNIKSNILSIELYNRTVDSIKNICQSILSEINNVRESAGESISNGFQRDRIMYILPIFGGKIEQNLNYKYEVDENGQIDATNIIAGKGIKTAVKGAVEFATAVSENASKTTGGKKNLALEGGKIILKNLGELVGDTQFMNALERKGGFAMVNPEKKIFKGTDYLSYKYEWNSVQFKDKESHKQFLAIIKMMQILFTPKRTSLTDELINGAINLVKKAFGDKANTIPTSSIVEGLYPGASNGATNNQSGSTGVSLTNIIQGAMGAYYYKMNYPPVVEGYILTSGESPIMLKKIKPSGVLNITTSLDLDSAFYEDTDLPSNFTFSIQLDELTQFDATSLFGDNGTIGEIRSVISSQSSAGAVTDADSLSAYKEKLSIL